MEGVEVLTITEADDGTRMDTIDETRESMLSHKRKGKLLYGRRFRAPEDVRFSKFVSGSTVRIT